MAGRLMLQKQCGKVLLPPTNLLRSPPGMYAPPSPPGGRNFFSRAPAPQQPFQRQQLSPSRSYATLAEKTNDSLGNGTFLAVKDASEVFEFLGELGRGGFAEVHRVRCRETNAEFACKSINKALVADTNASDLVEGTAAMKVLKDVTCEIENHLAVLKDARVNAETSADSKSRGSVIQFHQIIEDATHVHLIMDLCEGATISQMVKRKMNASASFGQGGGGPMAAAMMQADFAAQTQAVMKAAANAVHQCHTADVAHRDIKPENFAFANRDRAPESLRLLDFGLSRSFAGGRPIHDRAGSAYYVAPEVIQSTSDRPYDHKCDAWSVGVLAFYTLTSGRVPFQGKSLEAVFDSIKHDNISTAPLLQATGGCKTAVDFVERLLVKDPADRMSVADALEHDWLKTA